MTKSIFAIFCFPMQFHKHYPDTGESSMAEVTTIKKTPKT